MSPRNEREKKYWKDNAARVPYNVARGFIDPYKIPTFNQYPEAQIIANIIYLAHEKLKVTPGAPSIRRVSLRVYNDWGAFTRQLSVNLEALSKIDFKKY